MNLLQMSLSGGALILTVALLRGLLLNRLPKRALLALWCVPLARLLLPVSIASRFSVYSLLRAGTPAPAPAAAVPIQTLPLQPELPLPQAAEAAAASGAAGARISPWLALWLAGAAACALFFLISYLRCRREFRMSLPEDGEEVRAWLARRPLRRRVSLRRSDRISAPLTYGLVRPVILLPREMDRESLPYVLEHELVHIRRFDGVYKLALTAALCLHWFNPLVWLMVRLANRDIELSCDEAVLKRMGSRSRAPYARALVRMEERKSGLIPFCSGFSRTAIEARIQALMRRKKNSVPMAVLAAACIACAALLFATTAWAGEPEGALTEDAGSVGGEPGMEELLAEYAPFGVTEENGSLYYHGQLIRWFLDGYEKDGNTISRYKYYRAEGTVDVHTVREDKQNGDGSTELFGPIVDIAAYSQEEFDAADFSELDSLHTLDIQTTEASGSGGGNGRSLEEIFSDYGDFGVTFVPASGGKGNVYWNGELLRAWIDVKPGGDTFVFYSESGGAAVAYAEYDDKGAMTGVAYFPEDTGDAETYAGLQREMAEQWDAALAPYVPLGLSYEYDPAAGLNGHGLTMYYDGREVRGIVDEKRGSWITEHAGDGYYSDGAIELYAVYAYGILSGLRPATAEEQALWDAQRADNAAAPASGSGQGEALEGEWTLDGVETEKHLRESDSLLELFGTGLGTYGANLTVSGVGKFRLSIGAGLNLEGVLARNGDGVFTAMAGDRGRTLAEPVEVSLYFAGEDGTVWLVTEFWGEALYWTRSL